MAARAAVEPAPRVPCAALSICPKHAGVKAAKTMVGAPRGAHARLVLKERRAVASGTGRHEGWRGGRRWRRQRRRRRLEALVASTAAVKIAAHLPRARLAGLLHHVPAVVVPLLLDPMLRTPSRAGAWVGFRGGIGWSQLAALTQGRVGGRAEFRALRTAVTAGKLAPRGPAR